MQQFSAKLIGKALADANPDIRSQAKEFLRLCFKNNLHLTVVSGGISNVIASIINNFINISAYENFNLLG